MPFKATSLFAKERDEQDPLKAMREAFWFPQSSSPQKTLYFVGNSLGLQPKTARDYVEEVMRDWQSLAVEAHTLAKHPWYSYHELLTETTARLVGAKPMEVVVMNSLTVNLHLMLTSFYRPTPSRFKIVIESGAFPSDHYAVASHAKLHGRDPNETLLYWHPKANDSMAKEGAAVLALEDLKALLEKEGEQIALILLGQVNYKTGQAFALKPIADLAKRYQIVFGVDLAHGAGNLDLSLHDDGVDFAVWCSYKYLNAGPGGPGGCFVHEKHAHAVTLPRLEGWWGHDKANRFLMEPDFRPMIGAEGWQLSNPAILPLATLRASMELFDQVGMPALRAKSEQLTGYLEYLILNADFKDCTVITPRQPEERGCALSLYFGPQGKNLKEQLSREGVFCDYREPGILRFAPVPFYNSFSDVFQLVEILKKYVCPSSVAKR